MPTGYEYLKHPRGKKTRNKKHDNNSNNNNKKTKQNIKENLFHNGDQI